MTQAAIRQSGGASIISIPKAILRTLALDAGASLDLSIEGNDTPRENQNDPVRQAGFKERSEKR